VVLGILTSVVPGHKGPLVSRAFSR
jgi:hypothetical protein